MISEFFNFTNGMLESTWEGQINIADIIAYIQRTKNNKEYPRRLKILTSAEMAVFNLTIEDLKTISMENSLSLEKYDIIVDAFIVDSALEAALTTMYKQISAVKDYYIKIFSTQIAAIEWLELM